MSWIAHILHQGAELLLVPFDALPALLGLTLLSGLSGVGMLWVFGKTTPQNKIKRAKDKMVAAIYEVRLYLDSPRSVLAATGRMLGWSGAHLALMLPAFLIMGPPLSLLLVHMDLRYGKAPLPTDTPVLVKLHIPDAETARSTAVTVDKGSSAQITAPTLYIEDEELLYVRAVLKSAKVHVLRFKTPEGAVTKRLSAVPDPGRASPTRASGLAALWAQTTEKPLPSDGPIKRISVKHPPLETTWFWLPIPWWLYWLLVSMGVALLVGKRLGVEI